MSGPRGRAWVLAAVTVLLAVAAVVLLALGVEVRETTGGLLVTPYRQLHLVGGYLLGGTVAGVAAVLTAMSAVTALRRARRAPVGAATPPAAPVEQAPPPGAAHAASSPGSDRRE